MIEAGIDYQYRFYYNNGNITVYKKKGKGNWYKIKYNTYIKETGTKFVQDEGWTIKVGNKVVLKEK